MGVIADRKKRSEQERNALIILHENRLLSDSLTFYSWILFELLNIFKEAPIKDFKDDLVEFYRLSAEITKGIKPIIKKTELSNKRKVIV